MKRCLLIHGLCLALLPAWALEAKDAALEAQKAALPNYSALLTNETLSQTLPADALGDTQAIERLKGEDGMGDVTGAGRVKSDACMDKTDPECLAIQAVRGTAGWTSDLDDEAREAIRSDYVAVKEQTDDLTQGAASTLTQERICQTVTTHIAARESTEICDEGLLFESGLCATGWTMDETQNITYLCDKLTDGEEKTCEIQRNVLSHDEERWQCTVEPPVTENRTCTIDNHPTVDVIYPYTCTSSLASKFNKTCVKTLSVTVTDPCTKSISSTTYLDDFVAVGYSSNSNYRRMQLIQSCAAEFTQMLVVIANRPWATFTSVGQTVTFTCGNLTFNATLTLEDRVFTVTLTNVDAGQGVVTVTAHQAYRRNYQEVYDTYSETCNAS